MYRPLTRTSSTGKFILLRAKASDPATMTSAVRATLRQLLPTQPADAGPIAAEFASNLRPLRTNTLGILVIALGVLLLAAMGVYALVAYGVSRRTQEIGIRMALGASPIGILGLVVRETAGLAIAGCAAGLVAAFALNQFLRKVVVGVERASGADWWVFLIVGVVLVLVGAVACAVPARRALGVDALTALRAA